MIVLSWRTVVSNVAWLQATKVQQDSTCTQLVSAALSPALGATSVQRTLWGVSSALRVCREQHGRAGFLCPACAA